MKKEFTLGNALMIFVPVICIILAWTNVVSQSVKENEIRIELIEKRQDKIEDKIDDIYEITTQILVEVAGKKDR